MPIAVQCPGCQKKMNVPDNMAGKRGKCPACNGVVSIPGGDAVAAAPPPGPVAAPASPQPAAQPGPAGSGAVIAETVSIEETIAKVASMTSFDNLYMALVALGSVLVVLNLIAYLLTPSIPAYEPGTPMPAVPMSGFTATLLLLISGLMLVAALGSAVAFFFFIYRAWELIQDGEARVTPGQAAGFMMIPLYHLYWAFTALRGLCEDLNKYAQQRNIAAQPADVNMMTYAIYGQIAALVIAIVTPQIIVVLVFAGVMGLLLVAFNSVRKTCMDIARAKSQPQPA